MKRERGKSQYINLRLGTLVHSSPRFSLQCRNCRTIVAFPVMEYKSHKFTCPLCHTKIGTEKD